MARKPKSGENEEPGDEPKIPNNPGTPPAEGEQPFDPEAIVEDPSLSEIQEALKRDDLDGGSARIERRGPTDVGFAYIGKIKVRDFSIDDIKRIYGGGDYQVEFFRANGQKGGRHKFSIDPRFQGALDVSKAGRDVDSGTLRTMFELSMANRPDPTSGNIVNAMMKAQQDNTNLMVTMMTKSSEQQMAMMATMMTALAQAFGTKNVTPVNQGMTMQDVVGLVTLLKSNESKQLSIIEIVEAMKGLKEIGTGEPVVADPKSAVDKILEVIPHVASTVSALRGNPVPPPALPKPPTPPALPPTNPNAKPSANGTSPKPADEGQHALAQGMALIIKAAREKRDVGLYHDIILEMVPESDLPMLHSVLTSDSWFSTLFGAIPDAESLKPWLTELRDQIVETLNSPDEDGDDESAEPTSGPKPAEQPSAGGTDLPRVQSGPDSSGAS